MSREPAVKGRLVLVDQFVLKSMDVAKKGKFSAENFSGTVLAQGAAKARSGRVTIRRARPKLANSFRLSRLSRLTGKFSGENSSGRSSKLSGGAHDRTAAPADAMRLTYALAAVGPSRHIG